MVVVFLQKTIDSRQLARCFNTRPSFELVQSFRKPGATLHLPWSLANVCSLRSAKSTPIWWRLLPMCYQFLWIFGVCAGEVVTRGVFVIILIMFFFLWVWLALTSWFSFFWMLFILSFQCESRTEPPSKVTDIEIVRGSVRIFPYISKMFPLQYGDRPHCDGFWCFPAFSSRSKENSKNSPKSKSSQRCHSAVLLESTQLKVVHLWGSCAVVNCCPPLFFIFVYVYLHVSEAGAFSAEEGANAREGRPHKLRSSRVTDVTVFLHVFDTSRNRLWAVSESIPEVFLRIFNIVIVQHFFPALIVSICFHLSGGAAWRADLWNPRRLCRVGGPHPSCGGVDRKLSRTDCGTALSVYMLHMLHCLVCSENIYSSWSMSIDLKRPEAFWRTSLTPSGSWKVGLTRKRLPAPHRTVRLFESVWEMCGCWPLLHFYLADPGRSLEQGKTHAPRLAIFFWLPEMDRNSSGSGLGVFTGTSEARVTRSTDLDQPYRGRMVQLLATEAPNSMCQMTTQRGALRPLHPRWHCRISIDIRCRFFFTWNGSVWVKAVGLAVVVVWH